MTGYDLPALNAVLNGTAAILLVSGFVAIKAGRVKLHKTAMLAALAMSVTFLSCYLWYHLVVRNGESTQYRGSGRGLYLGLLISHTALAAAAAPLALVTAWFGLTGRLARHKKIARWTLPIWLYVSVTGVIIYLILKDQYPRG
jgi:putative membrane protein